MKVRLILRVDKVQDDSGKPAVRLRGGVDNPRHAKHGLALVLRSIRCC